ncbi:Golgin sub A member 2 [Lobulomyces angularis]|nr:Golgin sub A member 2 [Lobulomyces angularis]
MDTPFSKINYPEVAKAAESEISQSKNSRARRSTYNDKVANRKDDVKISSRPVTSKPKIPSFNPKSKIDKNDIISQDIEANELLLNHNQPISNDENIGQEALNRLLKAKLQVLQVDFEKLVKLHQTKETVIRSVEERLKLSDEEKNKALKNFQTSQTQLDKLKKEFLNLKQTNEDNESALRTLKKELDVTSKSQKQIENEQNSKDIRLNRSLEELEKQKKLTNAQLQKEKIKFEELNLNYNNLFKDFKKVEKKNSDLLLIFKKQQLLIEVLRKQKVHIEAAKLLQFTEEEFLKALNLPNY